VQHTTWLAHCSPAAVRSVAAMPTLEQLALPGYRTLYSKVRPDVGLLVELLSRFSDVACPHATIITLICHSDLHSELGMPISGTMLCRAKEPHTCLLHLPQMMQERFAAQRPVGAPPISVVLSIKESATVGQHAGGDPL
jgi:hypothetical protein